jgi:hypothetical protein
MRPTDSILIFVRKPTLKAAHGKPPNLQHFGDALIAELTYQTVFVGSIWQSAFLSSQAARLDAALNAALSSADCNEVFSQYFAAGTTISATPEGNYLTLGVNWPQFVYRNDLKKFAQTLLDDGLLPTTALESFALALVLPPGTILSSDAEAGPTSQGPNSMEGLGAYHGQFDLEQDGSPLSLYFCATVWSDGSNGAAVPADGSNPAWAPWENACAALYHELGEIRLCRNIDEAPHKETCPPIPDLGWLVWYKTGDDDNPWKESGDLSLLWAGTLPQRVFCKGAVGAQTGVPIQALWSNDVCKPFFPQGFTPQTTR